MGKPENKAPRRNVILVELDSVILGAPRWSKLVTARILDAFADRGYDVVGVTTRQPTQHGFLLQHLTDNGVPVASIMMRNPLDNRDYLELKQELVEMYQSSLAILVDNDLAFCRSLLHRGFSTLQTLGEEDGGE